MCVRDSEKSAAHSVSGVGGNDFGGSHPHIKILRLDVNQRLAGNTEEQFLYVSAQLRLGFSQRNSVEVSGAVSRESQEAKKD